MEKLLLNTLSSALGFYVAIALLFIFCIFSEYRKNGFIAALSFVAFSLVMYFWGGENTKILIALFNWKIIAAYFGIGLVHAVYRFYMEGRKIGDVIAQKRLEWKREHGIDSIATLTQSQETEFRYYLMGKKYDYDKLVKSKAEEQDEAKKAQIKIHEYSIPELMAYVSENLDDSKFEKYQIINPKTSGLRWWFNWPVSLVYYFFSEMFSQMWNFIWGKFKNFFNRFYLFGVNATSKE